MALETASPPSTAKGLKGGKEKEKPGPLKGSENSLARVAMSEPLRVSVPGARATPVAASQIWSLLSEALDSDRHLKSFLVPPSPGGCSSYNKHFFRTLLDSLGPSSQQECSPRRSKLCVTSAVFWILFYSCQDGGCTRVI